MQWRKKDISQYLKAKEYIDTVIIPLMPIHMSDDQVIERDSFQNEVLTVFTNELERELSGRTMLIPSYHYIKKTEIENEKNRLNGWVENMKEQPFTQIFLITYDSRWKKIERELDGTLIWLPAIQTGDLQSKELQQMIREQVSQIVELIRSYW
ncbi:YpiF family protein [Oceanobacillus senegalensis]|uniref:YpiF family protein n=1 Tax=Oceanobacillus senegalensis TaxID=1936063 RepID=UPI000A312C33|nr:YpiF family protein [Oceanobacillus senegalensis]